MISSGVWAGKIPLDVAYNLQDIENPSLTQRSELARIGYLGSVPASYKANPLAAHFELHIEQGPILESQRRHIGVVHGIQAYKWYSVRVAGQSCHTGTTPLHSRSDALIAASKMILHSHRVATKHGALSSTGVLSIPNSSVNVVPGQVVFTLDVRAGRDDVVLDVEKEIKESFEAIASGADVGGLNTGTTTGKPCTVEVETITISNAVHFHEDCIACVTDAAKEATGQGSSAQMVNDKMISGAGHDSGYTSYVCPTSMIFIPCKDGISHNPREYADPEDCAIGAQVLMQSVLRYDRLRATKQD
jgi:hydantoinase/carbamoylase family amidase